MYLSLFLSFYAPLIRSFVIPSLTFYFQQTVTLGISSLTSFGVVGVAIEVVLIAFLFVCSLVGLYTIPGIRCIRPIAHETTLTQIILNCGLYVILSSALPLLAKILGKIIE